jgi:NAD(P)-dependent dehydrogenase (short-subunit alcohol dehydrogenase family)
MSSQNKFVVVTGGNAVIGMTKAAAVEYGKFRIQVNVVCPGFTETAMLHSENANDQSVICSNTPHPRGVLANQKKLPRESYTSPLTLLRS